MRHPSLPQTITDQELQQWLVKFAVEKFDDTKRRYFEPEEIAEKEKESAGYGLAMLDLNLILSEVGESIKKGTTVEKTFIIPQTVGLNVLDKFRTQKYQELKQGYEESSVKIYGIVNVGDETMEYFTLDGEIMPDRTRPLSPKEKQQYCKQRRLFDTDRNGTNG